MENRITKKSVISGFFWRFAERCGAQGVNLLVSIVLARILEPEDYGLIALVTVFITVLNVFVDSGFGNALIQKKDADNIDFSSVFIFNIVACLALYMLMFAAAPFISSFYGISTLTPIIRVLSLTIVISGVKNVQQAYVSRNLLFKKFFFSTLIGTLVASVIGIWMAYSGYGIWALVAQQLVNITIDTVILWFTVKWRPDCVFSFTRLKVLFSYGWKLLISSLLETISNELRSLLIGKVYTSSDLAFYNQGQKFPSVIVTNINVSIDSVVFPTMSAVQKDVVRLKLMVRRAMMISTYIMAPLMLGIAVSAESIVKLVLTEKWLPCVFYLRIFCITFMFYPLHTSNLNAIKALGRSSIILKLQILKKMLDIILLLICLQISLKALAFSMLVSCLLGQLINARPNKKLLDYGYLDQMKDILPSIFLAIGMGAVVYFIGFLPIPTLTLLIIQVICGGVIYIMGSVLLKLEPYEYLVGIIKPMIQKRRKV